MLRELEAQAKALAPVLKSYITKSLAPIIERINELENRHPEKGDPGKDGEPGITGDKGETGLQGEKGDAGEKGDTGEPGPQGEQGKDGADGKDGKDISIDEVKALLETVHSNWALEFERRMQEGFQRQLEKMPIPKNGKDGKDALELEDIELSLSDDFREITLSFNRGELSKSITLPFPVPIFRGYYDDKAVYKHGDVVSHGGSMWISKVDSPENRPGVKQDGEWVLSVKHGRDLRK